MDVHLQSSQDARKQGPGRVDRLNARSAQDCGHRLLRGRVGGAMRREDAGPRARHVLCTDVRERP